LVQEKQFDYPKIFTNIFKRLRTHQFQTAFLSAGIMFMSLPSKFQEIDAFLRLLGLFPGILLIFHGNMRISMDPCQNPGILPNFHGYKPKSLDILQNPWISAEIPGFSAKLVGGKRRFQQLPLIFTNLN
jgi:hypothetical protein